jgi:hypothetical protein
VYAIGELVSSIPGERYQTHPQAVQDAQHSWVAAQPVAAFQGQHTRDHPVGQRPINIAHAGCQAHYAPIVLHIAEECLGGFEKLTQAKLRQEHVLDKKWQKLYIHATGPQFIAPVPGQDAPFAQLAPADNVARDVVVCIDDDQLLV